MWHQLGLSWRGIFPNKKQFRLTCKAVVYIIHAVNIGRGIYIVHFEPYRPLPFEIILFLDVKIFGWRTVLFMVQILHENSSLKIDNLLFRSYRRKLPSHRNHYFSFILQYVLNVK